ncbi:ABC transporter permease [Saccharibacillus sp. CPCC 101409]|uniref:ABC transporter permease n=1 Tax=Saccharibacillus sp. CPCC 101409 TaxID=3058041 RepID=UPI002670D81A|nr:ABC transporter permease [Saccharibacillus sp. CPCC 101409]MDO3410574.1 ABC transporter permease [Saccharibacillus sp. CPCC 101409]
MRIRALASRIIRQFIRDKRTMALLIVAPLLVLSLMYLVFDSDDYVPKLGTIDLPDAIVQQLESESVELHRYPDAAEADAALAEQDIDAYLSLDGATPQLKLEGSDPSKNRAVQLLVARTLSDLPMPGAASGAAAAAHVEPAIGYLHGGEDMTAFDSLGPIFIGVFAFFFVFLIAGVSFLKERTSGTLERLLATPLRRWEIVAGYIIGFGVFTGIQAILIATYCIHVLGLMMDGSLGLVLLMTLLLAVTALSFGMLLSTLANTEFQMIQFIPIVIVPQIFFSGLFDLDTMSPWISWLSHIMPLKYGSEALRNIMLRGEGWSGIALDVYVLIGISFLFMAANVLALRKYRKI